jgi:autotransporter-associated beta strand protein
MYGSTPIENHVPGTRPTQPFSNHLPLNSSYSLLPYQQLLPHILVLFMKTPAPASITRNCAASALLAALLAAAPLSAAVYTWDPANATNGATIDAGSGTWDTQSGNTVWNDAVANVAWSQTSATVGLNAAVFAGADAPEGTTYTITLGASVAISSTSPALKFSNNGYVLTAEPGSTHVITARQIATDSGKTATIAGPVTMALSNVTNVNQISGYGTLVVKDGAKINPVGNATVGIGSKLRLQEGAVFTGTGSVILGGQTSDGSITQVTVEGGQLNNSGTGVSIILSNSNGTSGFYSNTILTLSSGSITNSSVAGGIRFGGATSTNPALNSNVNGTINLDGGVLTVGRIFETNGLVTTSYNSTINFNGGTLRALSNTANGDTFLQTLNTARVKTPGAIIDTNGANITIGQALITDTVSLGGGLTKLGAGTLTLTGANTYTGATLVSAGTLNINAPFSALTATTVAPAARLQITSGATPSSIPELTLQEGSAVAVNLGAYSGAALATASVTTLNAAGNYAVDLTGTNIPVGSYTILVYGAKTGSGVPSLGQMPPGVSATISDTGSAIVLNVLTPQLTNYTWTGATNTIWDAVTANWTPGNYIEGSLATFPDLAGSNLVSLASNRSPYSVSIQNNTPNSYTFEGGAIDGSASVAKSGTGIATLSEANSFTGATTISQGALIVATDAALGTAAGATAISEGAVLGLAGGVNYATAEPVVCAGGGNTTAISGLEFTQRGAIQSVSGHSVFSGDVSISAPGSTRFGVQNGASLTLSGSITLAPGVSGVSVRLRTGENDGDFITLSGTNNNWDLNTGIYTGNNVGNSGVRLGVNNALPPGVSVTGSGSFTGQANTLDLNGFNQTMPGLTQSDGNLKITNLNAGTTSVFTLNTATVDYTNVPGTPTAASTYFTDGAAGAGKVAVVKKGAFKQTLQAFHPYTGATTIEAGTLAFAGTGALGATPVTMLAGSTLDVVAITADDFALSAGLAGSGTVNAAGKTVTVSTVFAPGALSVTGNLTLSEGTATTLVASTTLGDASAVTVSGNVILRGTLVINEAAGFDFVSGPSMTFFTGTISTGLSGVTVNGVTLTESAADIWTGTNAGLTYTFDEATANLAVSGGVVVSRIQAWRNLHFPTAGNDGTGIGADAADADGDGISNLVEYATNTSPVAANTPAVVVGTDAGRLTLTFPRIDDPSLVYTVQGRSDLATGSWTEVVEDIAGGLNPSAGFEGSNPAVTEADSHTVIDSVLISTNSKRFLRLSIGFNN